MAETFGDILAEARNRKGLTLEQVSEDLRIRPAILAALEREDYFGMPLKGHSRNMVSAYSRYLGLDSTRMTELFLQNYRDFEHGESNRRRGVPPPSVTQRGSSKPLPPPPTPARRQREQGIGQGHGQGVRSIWDRQEQRSELHAGYDSRSPRTQRSAKNAARRRPSTGVAAGGSAQSASGRQGRAGQPALGGGRQPRQPQNGLGDRRQGRSQGGGLAGVVSYLMGSTPLPLVLLVLALVALLVIWAVVANSCSRKPDDQYVPVLSNAANLGAGGDGGDGAGDALPGLVSDEGDIAPGYGPFILKLEPAPGMSPWVQVTVDGVVVFDDSLGETRSYEVTQGCKVQAYQTDNVKIYRNDVPQTLTVNSNTYLGTLELQVLERPVNDNTTNTPAEDGR